MLKVKWLLACVIYLMIFYAMSVNSRGISIPISNCILFFIMLIPAFLGRLSIIFLAAMGFLTSICAVVIIRLTQSMSPPYEVSIFSQIGIIFAIVYIVVPNVLTSIASCVVAKILRRIQFVARW